MNKPKEIQANQRNCYAAFSRTWSQQHGLPIYP